MCDWSRDIQTTVQWDFDETNWTYIDYLAFHTRGIKVQKSDDAKMADGESATPTNRGTSWMVFSSRLVSSKKT